MLRRRWFAPAAALVATALLVGVVFVPGLGRHGLWEPWEVDSLERVLEPAEDAEVAQRRIGTDGLWARGPLVRALTAAGHDAGSGEARVRLPGALAAVAGLVAALLLAAALFGVRVAVYSTVILASLPLTIASGRLIEWSALPALATTLVLGGGGLALFGPFRPVVNATVGLLVGAVGVAVGLGSAGPTMGVACTLVGAALGLVFARGWQGGRLQKTLVAAVALAAVAACAFALWPLLDEGYRASGSTAAPPTFELYFRQILLGSFPWTGLLVVGLVSLVRPESGSDRSDRAGTVLATGLAVAFLVQVLWSRAAGPAPFVALWPLAVGGGLLLARAEAEVGTRRLAGAVFAMLLVLGLRDHLLEPGVLLVSLADPDATWPEGVRATKWALLATLLVGVPAGLSLAWGAGRSDPGRFREWAVRWLGWLAPRGRGWARWLLPTVPVLLLVNGVVTALEPDVLWYPLLGCLGRRIWLAAGLVVPAGVVLALLAKVAWDLGGLAGRLRTMAVVAAGAALALVNAHAGLPAVSRHFSSRGVVQAYERLAHPDQPLLAYRTPTRAVDLLGPTEVEQVTTPETLVERLLGPEKAFAIVRTEDLAKVDVRFRKRADRHVPVVDDSSAKLLLVAGVLPSGTKSRNPLERVVPLERPRPSRPLTASFEDQIHLLGVDIEGPRGGDEVCPLDSFTVRYYWHCVRPVSGSYKIFVHVDGYGLRINGDHDPADGLYPVRDWQVGDYVVDEQTLKVPGHFRPGDYTIHVGFFQGSRRMKISDGPATRDNRLKAGVLRVR